MSERKEGFYWVQITPRIASDDDGWEAVKYESGLWFMAGRADYLPEGLIYSVGDRIPTPDEMEDWQVVPKEASENMIVASQGLIYSYDVELIFKAMLQAAPKSGDV